MKLVFSYLILFTIFLTSCSHRDYKAMHYKNVTGKEDPVIYGSIRWVRDSQFLPQAPITAVGNKYVFGKDANIDGVFKFTTRPDKYHIHGEFILSKKAKTKKFNLKKGDSLVLHFYLKEVDEPIVHYN